MKSFAEFRRDTEQATHEGFRTLRGSRVRSAAAFEEAKQHVLSLHRGVHVQASFEDAAGQVFDCVPIEQQPALRKSDGQVAAPPTRQALPGQLAMVSTAAASLRSPTGTLASCPAGTVPIRRVTLEEVSRFETLDHYLRKHGRPRRRSTQRRPLLEEATTAPHEYAHASQAVANIGGHSILSVWDPPIATNQVFSLSQHWYVAEGPKGVQTVEVGWQVYPEMYGHAQPVLFTYWTADAYQKTGSYSNTAGEFVQVGASHPVGMALGKSSVVGGEQVELELEVMLYQGNWWMFVNGVASGYYPGSHYEGGPLATGATAIDYGGETVGDGDYPPMGSGQFAERGFKSAAYQRNIFYIEPTASSIYATLVASQDWPSSYTIRVGTSDDWGEYFYFGGPGGVGTSAEAANARRSSQLVLKAPNGIVLEGLTLAGAAELIRDLARS